MYNSIKYIAIVLAVMAREMYALCRCDYHDTHDSFMKRTIKYSNRISSSLVLQQFVLIHLRSLSLLQIITVDQIGFNDPPETNCVTVSANAEQCYITKPCFMSAIRASELGAQYFWNLKLGFELVSGCLHAAFPDLQVIFKSQEK